MTFHLIRLKNCSIEKQLELEEHLLRNDRRNFCILNTGSTPAIVMGISGKKEELVDCARAKAQGIPILKRFSGGGTVIVDENTLFVTFICQKDLHPFPAYPEPIMRWTEGLYKGVLAHPEFALRENDYVLGVRKFGGNAQYIKKERWLHHTSFLWDYSPERMGCLLHPKKTPPYRAGRSHEDFLCTLKEQFPSKEHFLGKLVQELSSHYLTEEWKELGKDLYSEAQLKTSTHLSVTEIKSHSSR
ncbi:MAG: lipoate--protein ligase family protein [Verrucomicrobia bacterium]|nr:lipoate--protein ligase family protein [Verrucomicrobiota bacterium]